MLLDEIKKALLPLAVIETVEIEIPKEPAAEGEEAPPPEIKTEEQPALSTPNYQQKGFHLDVKVAPENVVAAAEELNRLHFFIEAVTGVDWLKEGQLEVVYDFNNWKELCRVVIRTRTDRTNPEVPTISGIFSGADWHERETHDFFGIKFSGLEDLGPFLLPEDADYHPLLKDFKA